MGRDIDLLWNTSTGELTFATADGPRTVGNYVKRMETVTMHVTAMADDAQDTSQTGATLTLKPVNVYNNVLAAWTLTQVGSSNILTGSQTLDSDAITTLLGTTNEKWNCVLDIATAAHLESETLAIVLQNNVTRSTDGTPTPTAASITASGYTMNTARILARWGAGAGAIQEATIGSGLSLSGSGVLSASGSGITINTTAITGGTTGRILYDNAGTVGEATTGTGVLTALGIAVGTNGAFITRGGNAGTPSAIVLTNATGTAAGLIAGAAQAMSIEGLQDAGSNVIVALGNPANGVGGIAVLDGGGNLGASSGLNLGYTTFGQASGAGFLYLDASAVVQQATGVTMNGSTFSMTGAYAYQLEIGLLFTSDAGEISSDGGGNLVAKTIIAGAATSLLLGTAGSAVGSVGFRNATSGTITVSPPAGALGNVAIVLPSSAGTLALTSQIPASFDPASPGAIGGTSPAAGTFTTVNAVGNVTAGGLVANSIGSQDASYGVSGGNFLFAQGGSLRWSSDGTYYGAADLILLRDAANTLALRNGENEQEFRLGPSGSYIGIATLAGVAVLTGGSATIPQVVAAGHGAVAAANLTTVTTTFANDGTADTTSTLAAGTAGQVKEIVCVAVAGFNVVVTVTNPSWGGAGTITMDTAYENITLKYLNSKWVPMVNNGAVLA